MTLEKSYREMLKEGNEAESLDEAKKAKKPVKEMDDKDMDDKEDMDEAEEPEKEAKKGDEPEKPKDVANRPADDSKKGLKEGYGKGKKKMKKEADDEDGEDKDMDDKEDDDDSEEDMDEQSAKETPAEREKRGVPAKKHPMEEAKKKMDESRVEASEKMNTLLEGQESLDEEHRDQVVTLFEAALSERTKIIEEALEEQYQTQLDEGIKEAEDQLVESLDTYLGKIVNEWLEENRLAVEQGVRSEITESFLSGFKALMEDHYVDVPDEKLDLVENILDENEEMEAELNKASERLMEANAELNKYRKAEVVEELSEGMTMTEKDRLVELLEDVDYSDKDAFTKKAKVLKENFLRKTVSDDDSELLNEDAHADALNESAENDPYVNMLSRMGKNTFDPKSSE